MTSRLSVIMNKNQALRKIRFILSTKETRSLALLASGTVVLSLSEAFSIGIIIPIMALFMNQDRIQTSPFLQNIYCLTQSIDTASFLKILIYAAICIFVFKAFYAIFINMFQQKLIGSIKNRITTMILESYLDKPYSFHIEHNSSVLLKNITVEVSQFAVGFLGSFVNAVSEMIVILGILFLLLNVYMKVTIVSVFVLGCILIGLNRILKKRIQSYSEHRAHYNALMYQIGTESLCSIKDIQLYNVRQYFSDIFSQALRKYTDSVISFTILSALPRNILEVIVFVVVMIGLIISVTYQQSAAELVPIISVFALALVRILPSANRIYLNFNSIQYYQNSLDIVYDIVSKDVHQSKSEGRLRMDVDLPLEPRPIKFEHIFFSYNRTVDPVLQDVNIIIAPHTTVAIVGETGTGKSTILDILLGFLAPTKGTLLYGDSTITAGNLSAYRKKIGYVPQQIYLIDDTIESNIAFGVNSDAIDRSCIDRAVRIAQLEDLLAELPEGIKTRVGEKGIKLSGGQRQRIGLARALYWNPEILVLDEATSALDTYTENQITKAIQSLKNQLTVVIVAHRLSTVKHANTIYVFEKNKIVSEGSYECLLENSPAFRKIASHGQAI